MNSEPKAFASLSSGLLARKGAARPAMRPQGFGQGGAGLEDLGWNDMGFEAPKPAATPVRDDEHDAFGDELPVPALRNPLAALTPVASPVHDQQAEIADRLGLDDEDEDEEEQEHEHEQSADGEDYVDETAELYEPEEEVVDAAPVSPLMIRTPAGPKAQPVAEPVAAPAAAPVIATVAAPVAVVHPVRSHSPRAAPGSKAKAAFTLRLDGQRHLKLRLACAVSGRSAQLLVTEALDQLLGAMPELEHMAERAPKKRAAS
ncbi:MAG: hypothetical protein ABIT69_04415 [Sphingomicrobium sp.]